MGRFYFFPWKERRMHIGERELFLPFKLFPWFREVPTGQLLKVELVQPWHLHWPDLDIDLDVESI